jgi:hypothetical protein
MLRLKGMAVLNFSRTFSCSKYPVCDPTEKSERLSEVTATATLCDRNDPNHTDDCLSFTTNLNRSGENIQVWITLCKVGLCSKESKQMSVLNEMASSLSVWGENFSWPSLVLKTWRREISCKILHLIPPPIGFLVSQVLNTPAINLITLYVWSVSKKFQRSCVLNASCFHLSICIDHLPGIQLDAENTAWRSHIF